MFRDAQQKLRRQVPPSINKLDSPNDSVYQAVRFRVYAYDANNNVLGELNTRNGYTLTWTVDVANKKASGYTSPFSGI